MSASTLGSSIALRADSIARCCLASAKGTSDRCCWGQATCTRGSTQPGAPRFPPHPAARACPFSPEAHAGRAPPLFRPPRARRAPMLVSYRWLSELLPDLDRQPEEVAAALSAIGLAVDGVTDLRSALRPVV